MLNMQDEARQGSSDALPYASWIHAGADRDTTGSETRTPEARAKGMFPRVAAAALVKTRQRRVKSVVIMHLFRTCVQITGRRQRSSVKGIPEQQAAKGNATCIARPMEDRYMPGACAVVPMFKQCTVLHVTYIAMLASCPCTHASFQRRCLVSRHCMQSRTWLLRTRIPVDLALRV